MYADICTKELVCACVLHVVVYVWVIYVCVHNITFLRNVWCFCARATPLAYPLLAAALLGGALV